MIGGCGKDDSNSGGRHNCGGPSEEARQGADINNEQMKYLSSGEGSKGFTNESSLTWTLTEVNGDYQLTVGDVEYLLFLNDEENAWRIMLSASDDQIFGFFGFVVITFETAIDSSHCGTSGYNFELQHNGKKESYDFTHPIL